MGRWGRGPTADPAHDDGLITPQIERSLHRGVEGMRALPIAGRFEAPDPARFEAEVVRAQLGPVVLRRTTLSPHRAISDDLEAGSDPEVLRLVAVQEGTLLAAPLGGRPMRLTAGDALFTFAPRTYAYQATDRLVIVSSSVPVTNLPAIAQRLDDLPVGPLPHLPLVDAVVDLLRHLARRLDEPWSFDADYAARGLVDLETAILTEMITRETPAPGPDRVYSAAVDYMELHLGEADLRPPQIAAALGVSLRYLHRAFDDKEMTVARHLRERRLEQVAVTLRAVDATRPLRGIASRFGFGSQDQLARAFRRRYGMSMTEYRSLIEAQRGTDQDAVAGSSIGITGQSRQSRSSA